MYFGAVDQTASIKCDSHFSIFNHKIILDEYDHIFKPLFPNFDILISVYFEPVTVNNK